MAFSFFFILGQNKRDATGWSTALFAPLAPGHSNNKMDDKLQTARGEAQDEETHGHGLPAVHLLPGRCPRSCGCDPLSSPGDKRQGWSRQKKTTNKKRSLAPIRVHPFPPGGRSRPGDGSSQMTDVASGQQTPFKPTQKQFLSRQKRKNLQAAIELTALDRSLCGTRRSCRFQRTTSRTREQCQRAPLCSHTYLVNEMLIDASSLTIFCFHFYFFIFFFLNKTPKK